MVTWDQARQIVDRELRGSWTAAFPELTFHVADWGYAGAQAFQVPYGARECLVDGDVAARIMGDPAALVDRVTGELGLAGFPGHLDLLGVMNRVGSGHPAA